MTYYKIFILFFKIGAYTFGGGYAMIPIITSEVVDKKAWIDQKTMIDYVAIAQAAPGMIALNMANLVGRHVKGFKGSLAAVFGVTLPSFMTIMLIATIIPNFIDLAIVQYALHGILISVIVLLMFSVSSLIQVIKHVPGLLVYAASITIIMSVFSIHIGFVIASAFIFGAVHTFLTRGITHD